MLTSIRRLTRRAATLADRWRTLPTDLEDVKIQQGRILASLNRAMAADRLADYEFKVFSQWGEDGIIQRLVDLVPIAHRTFIEFGVEDFSESNCRFLMMKDNWRGFVIDGSEQHVSRLRSAPYFWKHDLRAERAFITRENIDGLLLRSGFDRDLGLLSIDIDGNDYHVLSAVQSFRPRILVVEYNAVFGRTRPITVPYRPDFVRSHAHYSNLYFGASLAALSHLAQQRGYSLVGVNSAGSNAFFVRDDLIVPGLRTVSPEEAFVDSTLRESRDRQGRLTHLTGADRSNQIAGLPVVNVVTGANEIL